MMTTGRPRDAKKQYAIRGENPMDFWMKLGQQNMSFWKDMEDAYHKSMPAADAKRGKA